MRKSLLLCLCLIILEANCQKETATAAEAETAPESLEVENGDQNKNATDTDRTKKMFSFLQVMKFPNDVCVGSSSRNGTCYSSDECTSKGGTASGNCANGFGVCCVFLIGCGQTSSENNTFLVLSATTTPSPAVCTYTLCESNPSVCRIRLDFTTFAINGPQTIGIVTDVAATAPTTGLGGSVGDCTSDTFTLTAPNNRGSPVICGINTGQHMIIDTTSSSCAKATFDFGNAAVSRSYDIKVTQYNCADEMAGPPDCLQYFTGNTGTIQSFNFITRSSVVDATSTHLSNQNYNICFRRNSGKCALCFLQTVAGGTSATMNSVFGSFGLSTSGIAGMVTAQIDSGCSTDYIVIPHGVTTGVIAVMGTTVGTSSRFCGRLLGLTTAAVPPATISVCTGHRPFKVAFVTDSNEVETVTTASMATLNEFQGGPAGIIGFSLDFTQVSC